MKTIIFMRHGKSSWEDFSLSDDKRPLIPKGKKRTELVASYLLSQDVPLELILHSHAKRATDTAKILARKYKLKSEQLSSDQAIYFNGMNAIYDTIYSLNDEIDHIAVVGHNPDFTQIVNQYVSPRLDNLPTSGTVVVEFSTDKWSEIQLAPFQSMHTIIPKLLNK